VETHWVVRSRGSHNFPDNWLTDGSKVVSPLHPRKLLVLISVRGRVDPRAMVRLEEPRQLKNPMTSSLGMEPAKCLNKLRHRVRTPPPPPQKKNGVRDALSCSQWAKSGCNLSQKNSIKIILMLSSHVRLILSVNLFFAHAKKICLYQSMCTVSMSMNVSSGIHICCWLHCSPFTLA
jgi:hypothetical protein